MQTTTLIPQLNEYCNPIQSLRRLDYTILLRDIKLTISRGSILMDGDNTQPWFQYPANHL